MHRLVWVYVECEVILSGISGGFQVEITQEKEGLCMISSQQIMRNEHECHGK